MRKMMNKFLKLLVDNTILLILIVGTGIIVFLMLWNCSVKGCLKMTTSVKLGYASASFGDSATYSFVNTFLLFL